MESDAKNVPNQIGKYSINKQISMGTFGDIRFATDLETNASLCVKILNKDFIENEDDKGHEHQRREIETLAELDHPNIVQYIGYEEDENNFYIFTEYLSGRSLLELLNDNMTISINISLYIFKQLISALDYIHKLGISHRDLKLENITIDETYNAKIIDFGFVSKKNTENTLLTTFCGSLLYASPEIIDMKPYNGPAADMWSSGVILYTIINGYLPWDDTNIPKAIEQIRAADFTMDEQINPLCADLINSLLCVDPDKRLTASDVLRHPWLTSHGRQHCKSTQILSAMKQPGRTSVFFTGSEAAPKMSARKVEWKGKCRSLALITTEEKLQSTVPSRRRRSSQLDNDVSPDEMRQLRLAGRSHTSLALVNKGKI